MYACMLLRSDTNNETKFNSDSWLFTYMYIHAYEYSNVHT